MTPADGPRRAHRLAWITAALLGAVLVVVPATWQVWSWGNTRSDILSGGSDGRPVAAVEIVGADADITVTPRADRQVGYRATVSWSLRTPTIEQSRLGDTLRLTPHCPGEPFWPGAGMGCSVQLAVTVPVDVPVKVTTRSGRIALSGLGGTVDTEVDSGQVEIVGLRGALRAKVGSGRLHATGLASDRAEIRVGSGRAVATFVTPPDDITARVGSGRLALTVPAATRFKVRCEAGAGRCDVPDALRDAASPRSLDIEAGVGRAQAAYPDGPWAAAGAGDIETPQR
ncbi:hypothetical protein [Streptomyces sp. NPDC092307]|uniref:hypothetical protein n=1 Tax=Streptomyces sp. NPDC092307 TaxID=3366013 RepID=UPI003819AA69